MSVEGIVTTKPGLLDTSSERVTIEDASAGILLRLPANATTSVGARVRATGVVGTYYGAPQLSATAVAAIGQGTVTPTRVHSASVPTALEWRLVTVSGTVDKVLKDGDSWRAEIIVAGGSIPIVGLDRSGVPSTALVNGHSATVIGIVKRAYPTATDQRFAVVPRSSADISLGAGGGAASPAPTSGTHPGPSSHPGQTLHPTTTLRPFASAHANDAGGGTDGGTYPSNGQSGVPGDSAWPGAGTSSAVSIADLADHIGETVTIGGAVTAISGVIAAVDDGTGAVAVRLADAAAAFADELVVGDLVNVSGVVGRTAAGAIEIAVTDGSGIVRLPASSETSAPQTGVGARSSDPGATVSEDDQTPTSDSRGPLTLVALLLCLVGVGLVAFAAAGAQRRARLVEAWIAAVAAARSKAARLRAQPDRG